VLTLNTDMACDITVMTPGGVRQVEYEGDARIDGCAGHQRAHHHQLPGHRRLGLLRPAAHGPGARRDRRHEVTCIDNGMPLVIFKATDVGRTGYESVAELNATPN
jgi:4-oxalomesaconate tautomerase